MRLFSRVAGDSYQVHTRTSTAAINDSAYDHENRGGRTRTPLITNLREGSNTVILSRHTKEVRGWDDKMTKCVRGSTALYKVVRDILYVVPYIADHEGWLAGGWLESIVPF